jgi:Fructosamine kinase.
MLDRLDQPQRDIFHQSSIEDVQFSPNPNLTAFFDYEVATNGEWAKYQAAFMNLVRKTTPRLSRNLRCKGEDIVPSLVHKNLSSQNVVVTQMDGMLAFLNACALYTHNEYELGAYRLPNSGFNETYLEEYFRVVPISEPINDHDRIILYGIRFKLDYPATYNVEVRERFVRFFLGL